MKRILLTVAYDGTGYSGFQAQKSGVPTIEGELNRALTELTGTAVEVSGASRTDAGVHALCNLAVFDTQSRIPPEKFASALNVRLPAQICVQCSREVPAGFHPRFCDTVKTYEYVIYNARFPSPRRRRFTYYSYTPFDVARMQEAAQYLEVIRKERSDEQGNELWFPMMLGFFDTCPYARSRGLKGEEDLIRHFMHRQDLELRICKEVFPDRSITLESKNYSERDLLHWL